jgi:hypothetical protein
VPIGLDLDLSSMDIGNILNSKGNATAALQTHNQPLSALGREPGSNPGPNSGSLPARLSRSSENLPRAHATSVCSVPNMQMMSAEFDTDLLHENEYFDHHDDETSMPTNEQDQKSFACRVCAKSFTRRSDLSRHGKLL